VLRVRSELGRPDCRARSCCTFSLFLFFLFGPHGDQCNIFPHNMCGSWIAFSYLFRNPPAACSPFSLPLFAWDDFNVAACSFFPPGFLLHQGDGLLVVFGSCTPPPLVSPLNRAGVRPHHCGISGARFLVFPFRVRL